MKRFRILGMALLALFVVSAIASTTASAALPEFLPGAGVVIEGKTVGNPILETLNKTKVECTGGKSGGEITGLKTVSKVKITFTGCKSSGFSCTTPKEAAGTIVTHEITGTLGYISKAAKTVGILFAPTKAGDFFAEFDCAGGIVKNKVLGSVVCPIEKVNVSVKEFTLSCTQEKGDQKPTKTEESKETEVLKTSINGGAEEDSAEEAKATITTKVATEIMA